MTTKEFEEALKLFFDVLGRRSKKNAVFSVEAWDELSECADECVNIATLLEGILDRDRR